MNNLTEQQIRQIVKDEMNKNYSSGNPLVPPHTHNGTDNLNINPVDLVGWTPIPTTPQTYTNELTGLQEFGFGSPQQLEGGSVFGSNQFLNNSTIAQYPIPIVTGFGVGVTGAFNGGYAPEGTLVYFNNSTLNGLYIRIEGIWRGVNLNLTA
jgi:hypothetical protein